MDINFLLLALGSGLLSFSMPCNLIALPSFLIYLSLEGVSLKKAFLYVLIYGIGFSLVFTSIGLALLFVPGFILQQKWLQIGGGSIIIFIGVLFALGFFGKKNLQTSLKTEDNSISSENTAGIPLTNPSLQQKKLSYSRCFTLGISLGTSGFSCVLPVFSPILVLIAMNRDIGAGFLILMCYTLGILIPFFILGLFLGKFNEKYLIKIIEFTPLIRRVFGFILIFLGILYLYNAVIILGDYILFLEIIIVEIMLVITFIIIKRIIDQKQEKEIQRNEAQEIEIQNDDLEDKKVDDGTSDEEMENEKS